MAKRDLTGQTFGRWTVTGDAPNKPGDTHRRVAVRCACGTERVRELRRLECGDSASCGCLRDEQTRVRKRRHGGKVGGRAAPEYKSWAAAVQRCTNPNDASYPDYGGRGITICDRWRDDFGAFLADMGPRPSPKHTIDRKDVNGNYEPGNCRWATPTEQARNQRQTVMLTLGAETRPLADWAERLGISAKLLHARRTWGWSDERALTTPVALKARRVSDEIAATAAALYDAGEGTQREIAARLGLRQQSLSRAIARSRAT